MSGGSSRRYPPELRERAVRMVGEISAALGGHGAQAMKDAIASEITTLPQYLLQSLTWDRGRS